MENKINQAAQAIVDEVEKLSAAGRYPRRGWRKDACLILEDAAICNSVAALNAIKEAYCSWCCKCSTCGFCMDGGAFRCWFASTYRKRLAVLQDCEYGEAHKGQVHLINKEPIKYKHNALYELKKAVKKEYALIEDVVDSRRLKVGEYSYAVTCYAYFEEGNYGLLKRYMAKEGYYNRGAQKASVLNGFNKALKAIIKEVIG